MNFSHPLVRRLLIMTVVGILLSVLISEGAYQLLRENTDRDPQQVELVIPQGTAELVAAGETVPSIPDDMVFVVGDELVVKNEDVTDHQLGPVWIPPGSTGRLSLDQVNNYAYGCSFQPSRYLGLDVRPRGASLRSRILALVFIAPPTIALLAIYSTLVVPLRQPDTGARRQRTAMDVHLPDVAPGDESSVLNSTNGNGKTVG